MNRFSEKDWKLFRSKIVDWQEAYMEKLNLKDACRNGGVTDPAGGASG